MQTIEYLLRKGLSRVTCVRSRVAAVTLLPIGGYDWTPVSLGWNHEVLERGGVDCASECPRSRLAAGAVVPGVTSYDSGLGSCIAMHAEEHALRGLRSYDKFGDLWGYEDVLLLTTRAPCYKCEDMLRTLGVAWSVVDLERDVGLSMPSPR